MIRLVGWEFSTTTGSFIATSTATPEKTSAFIASTTTTIALVLTAIPGVQGLA